MTNNNISPELMEYALGPELRAFSTTRRGGLSTGNYGAFNINPYCGDAPEHVTANRSLLCRALGIADDHLLLPHQTHGHRTLTIDDAFFDLSPEARAAALDNVDALITNLPATCIGVSTADCVPLLLYDATHHAIAAVHAGWRGTVQQIAAHTIDQMSGTFGTNPADLRAVIGPSISAEAFEVGDEVYEAFAATRAFPMDNIAHRHKATSGAERWHIDLWAANVCTLEAAGLDLSNIQVAGLCTYSHSAELFSARRLGIDSGRLYTGIMLKA